MNTKNMLLAVGLAGLAMGFLSGIPILKWINCLLCVGLWGSGILAVWLYRTMGKDRPGLSLGQGALLGALAGLAGALVSTFLTTVTGLLFGGTSMLSQMEMLRNIPGMSSYVSQVPSTLLTSTANSLRGFFVSLICTGILYPIFGALGGLLATGLIWKKS
jgi:hypothetical protein